MTKWEDTKISMMLVRARSPESSKQIHATSEPLCSPRTKAKLFVIFVKYLRSALFILPKVQGLAILGH